MTPSGWLIMFVSVGVVSTLFVWSINKVLTTEGEDEKIHGFAMETPDTLEE